MDLILVEDGQRISDHVGICGLPDSDIHLAFQSKTVGLDGLIQLVFQVTTSLGLEAMLRIFVSHGQTEMRKLDEPQ